MELDIIDGLKLRGVAASTFNLTDNPTHVNTMTFYQAGSDTPVKKTTNSITEYDIKSMELNLQAYLDYNKTFGKHTIGALLGYSQIYKQTRYLQAYRKNLPNSNSLDQINAGGSDRTDNIRYRNRIRPPLSFRTRELFIR